MNQREQTYRNIRATRGIQPHPADVRSDAVTTDGGTGRLRTSAQGETGHVERTLAASEGSQRPSSRGRSYVGFAGFILPQEITLAERALGRSSIYLHRGGREAKKRLCCV